MNVVRHHYESVNQEFAALTIFVKHLKKQPCHAVRLEKVFLLLTIEGYEEGLPHGTSAAKAAGFSHQTQA